MFLRLATSPPDDAAASAAGVGDRQHEGLSQEEIATRSREAKQIAAARDGDVRAWTALYTHYYPVIYRRLRLLTGSNAVAEDLAQETFVQAMLAVANFGDRSRFGTWLCGIAMNLGRMWWRRQTTSERVFDKFANLQELDEHAMHNQPDTGVMHEDRVAVLYAALSHLPENLRLAFVLRDLEGLSPEAAAAELGISTNNLLVRATRARVKIREFVAKKGWPEKSS
jgi:RNA polymerase sigma-70 factor (ECF subfamily)